jgi:ABC-type transport system involved in multi-copper enzyme maturation permease subunit
MTFLPIVERELRMAARLRGTYWTRVTAAGVAVGLGAWVLQTTHNIPRSMAGGFLFAALAAVLFIYTAIAGTRLTSDCLSEEKREGTLGLLFLTDLKGYDVVIGKLVATSLNAFYGMLAVVPILAVSLLLGGVTKVEFWRVALVSVNLLFFFLSAGLFASSLCREDNRARTLAVVLVTVILGAAPLWAFWENNRHPNYTSQAFLLPSPAYGCFAAFDARLYFWPNLAITHLYAWGFLSLSCSIVPRSWQDTAVRCRLRLPKARSSDVWTRRHLLRINPFLWRAHGGLLASLKPWLTMALLAGLWFWPTQQPGSPITFDSGKDLFFLIILGSLLKVQVAGEASRALGRDRQSGALELLLTTPLSERDILRGQRLALWKQFAAPVTLALVTNVVCYFGERFTAPFYYHRPDHMESLMHLGVGFFLLLDMNALSWVSMWLAVKTSKVGRASMKALLFVIILPTAAGALLMPIWTWFIVMRYRIRIGSMRGVPFHSAADMTAFLICLFGFIADLAFGWHAKKMLRSRFRAAVAEQFTSTKIAK